MSATHITVKLSRSLVEEARQEADAFSRSVAAQIEHWVRLGRAVEAHDVLSHGQTRTALSPRGAWDSRDAGELAAIREAMIAFFRAPPPGVDAAYREIGSRPGAVGRDEDGVLVRVGDDGKPHPI